jgi:Fe2+ transport system protein FeoA
MIRSAFILLLLSPSLVLANTPSDLDGLMETARIEGQASGTLGGAVAARLRGMGIKQPVEVTVKRLYRLKEPGCARLKVSFDQRNVTLPGETVPKDRHAEFAMNRCEGGRPPASAAGAQAAAKGQP